MMRFCYLASIIAAVALSGFRSEARNVRIAEKGKSCFSIVCPEDAAPAVEYAAAELEKYLELITKADFKIVRENQGPSIVVCEAVDVLSLTGRELSSTLTDETFGQFRIGDDIVLAGGRGRSVLYSVYDFLEQAGCIWAAPAYSFYEGRHEFVPEDANLVIDLNKAQVKGTESPYRKLYITSKRTEDELIALTDWMPKARYNIAAYKMVGSACWNLWRERMIPEYEKRDIMIEDGGHGYDFFIGADMEDGTLFEKHPEWFGVNKRFGDPEHGNRSRLGRITFCTSNDEAVAYMHRNLEKYLGEHPELDIFDFWPQDSELWCECENCRALGSESDQHARLVKLTSEFLKDRFPDLKLECLAYHFYYAPSEKVLLPDNILVDFADFYQNFEHHLYDGENEANRRHDEALRRWTELFKGDISIYSYFCKGFWRGLPNVIPHYIQDEMKYYRSLGIKGASVYSEPNNWFSFGLNLYSLAKTAWDPETDIEEVIDSYCKAVYGDNADIAKYAYAEFEDIVRFACVIHQTTFKTDEEYDAYRSRLVALGDKIEGRMETLDRNTVGYRHLERLQLMDEYAVRSTDMMKRLAAADRAKKTKPGNYHKPIFFDQIQGVLTRRPPLDEDLEQWLVEHRGLGVFAE